jgi:hypothetical protein
LVQRGRYVALTSRWPIHRSWSYLLADFPEAESDSALPPVTPESGVGAYGFSRYVYQQQGEDVVAALVEGPRGRQVRCQAEELDCSYQELKDVLDSGEEIPEYLGMDRETLGELVGQLERVEAAVAQYETIGDACAAGMRGTSRQNANMGIHVTDPGARGEFNPDRPQMILFAKDGGGGIVKTCGSGFPLDHAAAS